MRADKSQKRVVLKAHVSVAEREALQEKAKAAGISMSRYLLTVGLGRQTSIQAERLHDFVQLLETVLARLVAVSDTMGTSEIDSILALRKLSDIENYLTMMMPISSFGDAPEC